MRWIVFFLTASLACAQAPAAMSSLRGNRFPTMSWEQMTPEQRTMIEHILATGRPTLDGPFNVLLRSPSWGDLAQQFGGQMRFLTSVPAKLREMAIILVAREWSAEFEWQAHRPAAVQAGLDEAIVKAIAEGRRPEKMSEDESAVYNFTTELLKTKKVSDATFATAKQRIGEKGVVDLIGVMGWYQLVAMMLNVDQYPLAEGMQPELK